MVGYDLPCTASELQGPLVWNEDWDCYICEMSDGKESLEVTRADVDKELVSSLSLMPSSSIAHMPVHSGVP